MLARKCDVLIYQSNLSTIPKQVYEHEIPVIETIFGEGTVTKYDYKPMVFAKDKSTGKDMSYQVQSTESATYDVEEVEHDEEYMRMMDLYGKHQTIDIFNVTHVYGRQEDNKMETKGKELYGKLPKAKPEEKSSEEEDMVYSNMTKNELKEMLGNLEVPYPPNATKFVLIDLAESHDRGELEKVS